MKRRKKKFSADVYIKAGGKEKALLLFEERKRKGILISACRQGNVNIFLFVLESFALLFAYVRRRPSAIFRIVSYQDQTLSV